MKTEIFNNYIESKKAINKLVEEIWNYIDENYKEYLEFGKCSRFHKWSFNPKDGLSISYYDYGYDLFDNE